jgi:hypothetical protein
MRPNPRRAGLEAFTQALLRSPGGGHAAVHAFLGVGEAGLLALELRAPKVKIHRVDPKFAS